MVLKEELFGKLMKFTLLPSNALRPMLFTELGISNVYMFKFLNSSSSMLSIDSGKVKELIDMIEENIPGLSFVIVLGMVKDAS
jgi:hypothetical protein